MTRTTPRNMLSNRPGSTTPTRRSGSCQVDDVRRSGESLLTSAWPTFFKARLAVVKRTKTTSKRHTTLNNRNMSWQTKKWLALTPLDFYLYPHLMAESRLIKGRSFTFLDNTDCCLPGDCTTCARWPFVYHQKIAGLARKVQRRSLLATRRATRHCVK